MTQQRRHNVHVRRFIEDIQAAWPVHVVAIIASLGGGWAIVEVFADELRVREGLLAGALIFLGLEFFVLYNILRTVGDQLDSIVGGAASCQLIAGPRHAKLQRRETQWESEGVVWIGAVCDPGSRLDIRLRGAPKLRVQWAAREHMDYLWTKDGVNAEGAEAWSLTVPRTQLPVTPLGQFYVQASNEFDPSSHQSLHLTAGGQAPNGAAISAELDVGVLADVSTEAFKPLAT